MVLPLSLIRVRAPVTSASVGSVPKTRTFAVTSETEAVAVADEFRSGLRALVATAEGAGARVVLGSVYPHAGYNAFHYKQLLRVAMTMRGWEQTVFDFLKPLDDGKGRWRPEVQSDPGHPNSEGHRRMFEATRLHWHLLRAKPPTRGFC